MLDYVLRIRDLVHGTILFTKEEVALINHPFFQRLRQIRQNDVAFFVYPSLNTSRFEHTLGVCRVAGMMAETLVKSPKWKNYSRELRRETGIGSKEDFIRLCRFYALLHDIGHFPLSHLFEYAMKSWAHDYAETIREWTTFQGFEKLHEAFGALVAQKIASDIKLTGKVKDALLRLMKEKTLPYTNPLSVVKSVIDAEIDADRIDFVQRDGLAAGGEYGHYDIRRLCDSVFIEQRENDWIIAYSEKALTSMEAVLLDRYRTYAWIHFHHKVIAMKMLVRFLIVKALELKIVTKEQFDIHRVESLALKDDVWLWNVLRNIDDGNKITRMVQGAVFYRKKANTVNLWKTRPEYHELQHRVMEKTQKTEEKFDKKDSYSHHLSSKIKAEALVFEVPFEPIGEKAIYLYSEAQGKPTGRHLLEVSRITSSLETIWKDETQYYVLLVGKNVGNRKPDTLEKWVDATTEYVLNPTLW